MNNLKNKVQLIGHLGAAPEIKNLTDQKMARMSIATNETYYKKSGEKVENTQWHNVVAYGKLAEIVEQYVHKGREVCVQGKLQYRRYDDKEGITRYITEVRADELLMLGSREKAS